MSSGRDEIALSAEWRTKQYAEEFVTKFMDDITDLMLLITDKSVAR